MGTGGLILRRARARFVRSPTGFCWIEPGKVCCSGYPASRRQLQWLSEQGVNSVVTLTEKRLPEEWGVGLGIGFWHIPMKDHEPPDVVSLDRAAGIAQEQVADGKVVLVHCMAGEGRSGCVLAAYLVRDKMIGAEEALWRLRKVKPRFVEAGQEKAVFEYASWLSQGRPPVT